MTATARPARTFRFPRPKTGTFAFRRRSSTEFAVGLAGSAVAIVALLVAPLPLKAVGVAFAGACWAAGFAPYRGRTYVAWWEVSRAHKRLLSTGSAEWRSSAPTRGIRLDGTPLEVEPPPGIGRLTWLRYPTSRGDIAVLLQHDQRTLTAALEVEGESVFGAQDPDEQEQTLRLFQDLLDGLGNGRTRISRLGWYARVFSGDPEAHMRDVEARSDPDAPERLLASYHGLASAVTVSAEEHRLWCVASIDVTPELLAAANDYTGSADVGLAREVAKEVDDLIGRLERAQLRVVGVLDEARLAAAIHSSYDSSWHQVAEAPLTRATAWPANVDARPWGHVEARTWQGEAPVLLATAWWYQWPQVPVGANFLAPLLLRAGRVTRTSAVVMDLQDSKDALGVAMANRTTAEGRAAGDRSSGQLENPMDAMNRGEMATASQHHAAGAAGVAMVGYVTIAAGSTAELESNKRDVESAAARAHLGLEWCDGEHYRALVNTLPFARGLAR
jgi:hypothetical protein